jgi:hypothetical protein
MCYKYGWVIKSGQKYFTTHHEEGARDKNLEAEKRETLEVGRHETTETGGRRVMDTSLPIPPNQFWFG